MNSKIPDEQLRVEEKRFARVKVEWPDGRSHTYSLSKFTDSDEGSAWLILVDQSRSLRKTTIDAIKQDFGKIVMAKDPDTQIGIGSFSQNFQMLAPIGSDAGTLTQAMGKLEPVGDRTFIYQSVLQALPSFDPIGASRRALVVVTDGKEEDPNQEDARRRAISEAKKRGVVVYSVAYLQAGNDTPNFSGMRELAESTGGPFRQANLQNNNTLLSETFSERFYEFLMNGGSVNIPLRTLENDGTLRFTISALVDGADGLADLKREVVLPYSGPKISESILANIVNSLDRAFAFTGIKNMGLIVFIALILVILALIGIAVYVLFFRPGSMFGASRVSSGAAEDTVGPATGIEILPNGHGNYGDQIRPSGEMATTMLSANGGSGDEVYGWLEVMGSGNRIPLNQTGLRIGRHEDNDIRFDASTVHRRHAIVHMTPQREFIITDLSGNGGNGVEVNANRVERAELKDGDVIQLGEVRVKFHAATI